MTTGPWWYLEDVRGWCAERHNVLERARATKNSALVREVRAEVAEAHGRLKFVTVREPFWVPEPGSELADLLSRWVIARAFHYYSATENLEEQIKLLGGHPHVEVPSNSKHAERLSHLKGPVLGPAIRKRPRGAAQELLAQVGVEAKALLAYLRKGIPKPKKLERVIKFPGTSVLEAPGCEVVLVKHFLERFAYRRGNLNAGRFFNILPKLVEVLRSHEPRAVKMRVSSDCYIVARLRGERATFITVMPVKGTTEQERALWHTIQNPGTDLVDARESIGE